jgi:diguanylate cyclase (GGDEF)-like protein
MRLAIRGTNRHFNIARYGGDEFAILIRAKDENEIFALEDRIRTSLDELNKEAGSPYELTVSIGHEQASRGATLKELIEKADTRLYEEKKKLGNVRE